MLHLRNHQLRILFLLALAFGICAAQVPCDKSGLCPGGIAKSWTLVQHAYDYACTSGVCTVDNTTGTNRTAMVATTAGNLLVVVTPFFAVRAGGVPLTSMAVAGDTFVHCNGTNWPQNFQYQTSDYTGGDCYYVLSAAGGATSITATPTWGASTSGQEVHMEVLEYAPGSGTAALDITGVATNNACTTCAAPTVSLSGSKDVCVQLGGFNTNPSAISGAYTNPADIETTVAAGVAGAINVTSYSAPNWTLSSATNTGAAMGTVCFK